MNTVTIETSLADNQIIIANTVNTLVFKSLDDFDSYRLDDNELSDYIPYDIWDKIITALRTKKTAIIVTGQYRYDYDGGLCYKMLDYEII